MSKEKTDGAKKEMDRIKQDQLRKQQLDIDEAIILERQKTLIASQQSFKVQADTDSDEDNKKFQSDWPLILKNYHEFRKEEQFSDDIQVDESGMLVFPSMESAVKFFTAQANLGYKFLAERFENNQPTGDCQFSCGNGQLFSGTLETIKSQLEKALELNPDDEKLATGLEYINTQITPANNVNQMRDKLASMKMTDTEEPVSTIPTPKPR